MGTIIPERTIVLNQILKTKFSHFPNHTHIEHLKIDL